MILGQLLSSRSYSSPPHVMQKRDMWAQLSLPTANKHPSATWTYDQEFSKPSDDTQPPLGLPVECSGQWARQEDRSELVVSQSMPVHQSFPHGLSSVSHTPVLGLTGQKPSVDSGQVVVPCQHSQHPQLPLLPALQRDEASALSGQLHQMEGQSL